MGAVPAPPLLVIARECGWIGATSSSLLALGAAGAILAAAHAVGV